MERLEALRWDLDFFPGRFAIFRCTIYRCPYCQHIFKLTWGPKTAFLGRGERVCRKCKKSFRDNSKEWPEMSSGERQLFLVPISVAGWLSATIIIAAVAVFAAYERPSVGQTIAGLLTVSVLLLPLFFWFGYRGAQIVRSARRYNERGGARTR